MYVFKAWVMLIIYKISFVLMPVQAKPSGSPYLECFRKSWPAIFRDRIPHREEHSEPHVEFQLEISLVGEPPRLGRLPQDEPSHIKLFLRGYDNDGPESGEIETFCAGVHPSVLRCPGGSQRRAAWLDDRSYSFYNRSRAQPSGRDLTVSAPVLPDIGNIDLGSTATENGFALGITEHNITSTSDADLPVRTYESPLSAAALYDHLKQKVRVKLLTRTFVVQRRYDMLICFSTFLAISSKLYFGLTVLFR